MTAHTLARTLIALAHATWPTSPAALSVASVRIDIALGLVLFNKVTTATDVA
jgi:hypothetical protein